MSDGDETKPATRGDVVATLAIVIGLATILGGRALVRRFGAHPTQETCDALLDRYAEHLARAVTPSPTPSAMARARAEARAKATERRAIARCVSELTPDEAACAMDAPDADAFERCIQ